MRPLAALVVLLTACTPEGGEAAATGSVAIGGPVPAYTAVSLDGAPVSLAQQQGKVLLLNVWATWCHPCRDEIPVLQAVYDRYRSRGLEVVGVSVDTEGAEDNIRAFMQEFRMQYPVWLDPAERISTQFLIVGVPATFLIDRKGVLRWRRSGPVPPGDTTLATAIERALAN